MSQDLAVLLQRCGIIWQDETGSSRGGPLQLLGRVSPESNIERGLGSLLDATVWCAAGDWPATTAADLESWLVDAARGRHVIILHGNTSQPEVSLPPEVRIILRLELSQMLGEHLLEGGELAPTGQSPIGFDEDDPPNQTMNHQDRVLEPLVRPEDVLDRLGFTGLGLSPLHIEARVWDVSGRLRGPDGQLEPFSHLVLEDPWRQSMIRISEGDFLANPPQLSEMSCESLLSESMARIRISEVLGERRRSELDGGGGMVLRRWFAELDEGRMQSNRVFLPAWRGLMPGHGESILHGLDGSIHPLSGR